MIGLGWLPCSYFRATYASETAGGLMAALMLLQGFELVVNALRSYSSIRNGPGGDRPSGLAAGAMLGSVWVSGLKLLFAQSVGADGPEAGAGRHGPPDAAGRCSDPGIAIA